jgi:hypothetical protein
MGLEKWLEIDCSEFAAQGFIFVILYGFYFFWPVGLFHWSVFISLHGIRIDVPIVRIGHSVRVRREDLQNYLKINWIGPDNPLFVNLI